MEANRARLLLFVVVLVPLLVVAGYVLLYDSAPIASSGGIYYTGFSVGGKTFPFTYLATNQSMLDRGLMDKKVTDSTTMLFVFTSPGYYPFWMFGVNSSLDIIWVDAPAGSNVGKVVYLVPDAPPCHVSVVCTHYQPSSRADFVIEAKGGFAAANGIDLGTTVVFK
jgi:uncharacterized membrane protein (UPF0127 family)